MLIELTDPTTHRPILVNTAHVRTVRSAIDGTTRSHVLMECGEAAVVVYVTETPDQVLLRARNADPRSQANELTARAFDRLVTLTQKPATSPEDDDAPPLRFEPIIPPLRRPQRPRAARDLAARGPGRRRGR